MASNDEAAVNTLKLTDFDIMTEISSQGSGKQTKSLKKKRKKSLGSPSEKMSGQSEKRVAMQGLEGLPTTGGENSAEAVASQASKSSNDNSDIGQSPKLKGQGEQLSLSIQAIVNPIMNRLNSIDKKLVSLTSIEKQLTTINNKISSLDTRLTENERVVKDVQRTVSDLEVSRNFDSATLDSLKTKTETNKQDIFKHYAEYDSSHKKLNDDIDSVRDSMTSITDENRQLKEELIELKARSMRDNLLFYNFAEQKTNRKNESCIDKIYDFCELELDMPDVRENVKIDRAHRIGPYKPNKIRPIVAKFNFFQDKERIKQRASEKIHNSRRGVGDQYPKEIQQRRRALIPVMKKAQRNRHAAVLSYDKLFVDGTLYDPDNLECVELVNQRRERQNNGVSSRSNGDHDNSGSVGASHNQSLEGAGGSASAPNSPMDTSSSRNTTADKGARPKTYGPGRANASSYSGATSSLRGGAPGQSTSRGRPSSKSSDVD